MDYISQANVGGTTYALGLPHVYKNDKSNLCIETTAERDQYTNDKGKVKGGKINIEAASDIQIKPGDDVTLYSHHRAEANRKEVTIKAANGEELERGGVQNGDYPVDLQINAANINLTTKDKSTYISEVNIDRAAEGKDNTSDSADVLNIEVNSDKGVRGYLKVRAQAIDLRSETHGGIALQPKGYDSDSHMNKIKFEHGGGDGLEFGTFNTEKTSIFTDEYRFNKEGVWKMATRVKETSDKADQNDATTAYKYQKQADDFYDVIDADDEVADTNSIIKTANAFNYGKNRHAKYEESLNTDGTVKSRKVEIECVNTYQFVETTIGTIESFVEIASADEFEATEQSPVDPEHLSYNTTTGHFGTVSGTSFIRYTGAEDNEYAAWNAHNATCSFYLKDSQRNVYYFNQLNGIKSYAERTNAPIVDALITAGAIEKMLTESEVETVLKNANNAVLGTDILVDEIVVLDDGSAYRFAKFDSPKLSISAVQDVNIKSKDGELKLGGETVGFDTEVVNFGELEQGLEYIYKSTKSGNRKQCDVVRVLVTNNTASSIEFTLDTYHPTNYVNFTDEGGDALEEDDPIPTFCKDNVTIAKGKTAVVAQCSIYDIIKLVDYFKNGDGVSNGPWASQS